MVAAHQKLRRCAALIQVNALKQTVFEYPETEWARRARGLLLQEGKNFKEFE